ncbi:MAG: SDR family oxidoreductase [Hyphomicrobiaceae bacterium]|nr:SDR family oxidoreductase [Hyphomicrobiaceae bacterium]
MKRPSPGTVLITGAGRRIGRAIALAMAEDGWRIGIHYRRSRQDAEELAAAIKADGGKAVALPADLGNLTEVKALIPLCCEAIGAPCCLINNASEFQPDTLASTTPESWHLHLDINLKAPVFLAQALAEALPAGVDGNVINIIDQRVWKPSPDFFSYTVSKAGLWAATRTLAQALAPRIRVNAIGPGPILQSIHQTDADFAQEIQDTLLRRGPSAEEIAAAVRFILAAPAMTGQMIALDAGQHLAWRGDRQNAPAGEPGES